LAIPHAAIDEAAVTRALRDIYIPGPGTRLRAEEAQKVAEMVPLLQEIDACLRRFPASRELVLVDAAAGRGYVSLLSARLLLAASGRTYRWVVLEREPRRAAAVQSLAERLGYGPSFDVRCTDLGDAAAWPQEPALVVALHSCGPAADLVIERSLAVRARALLLVPCCVSKRVASHQQALGAAEQLSLTRHAPIRRRFLEAVIASERARRLESAGYRTEVVEFCPPRVTPHNLVYRCRRIG
jgi:Methyltransferase domain